MSFGENLLLSTISIIISVFFGVIGYLVANFWFKPILRYKDIKHDILSSLMYYANVIDPKLLNDKWKEKAVERMEKNRFHASVMHNCYLSLPIWYKWKLKWRNEKPEKAAAALIGLSNTSDAENGYPRVEEIKRLLKYEGSIEN